MEKPLLQMLQMCGFSPVCVLMCLFNRLGRSKDFPQTEQGSMVFSRGRLVRISIDLQLFLWHLIVIIMVLLYHCILPPRATSVVNQWWGKEHKMVGWQEEARLEERGGRRGVWGEAGSLVAGICLTSWAPLSFNRGSLENDG